MSEVKFRPVNGFVLIELPDVSSETESGIFKGQELIDEESAAADHYIKIVAVAKEVTIVEPGERVLMNVTQINKIGVDGVEYGLTHQSNIVGVKVD